MSDELSIDEAQRIATAYFDRRNRWPGEDERMSLMVVLMNYGDQHTRVEQRCGTCRHWKLWPPNDELESVMICLAPLPTWVMEANGNQETRHDQGTSCDVWEQRGHR